MQAKFVGRWVPSGNSMTTGYPGSSFSFRVSGTNYVNVSISGATRIAYKVDDGPYVVTNNVQITGLTLSTHKIKIVLTTSIQTWAGNNYAQVTGIEVASGGSIIIEPATKRKCLVFGDSITEGYNANGQSISASECTWWNKLGDMLNMDVTPVGIGGIGYVSALTPSADYPSVVSNPSYIENITETMTVSDTDYDLVIIELGTNDNKSKTDVDNTYVTNVTSVVSRIKAKYPNADIHALIPFTLNGQPSLNQAYCNTNVSIIPTSWYSGITFADSLHPNETGNSVIAMNVYSYLLNRYGEEYFKEVTMDIIDNDKIIRLNNGLYAKRITQSDLPDFFLGSFFQSENDQYVRLYSSLDGVSFTDLKKLDIIRDTSIQYYKNNFYLVVYATDNKTFRIYKSKDLQDWTFTDYNVFQKTQEGGQYIWAPDLFIDDDGSAYVYFAYPWGKERVGTATSDNYALDVFVSYCDDIEDGNFGNSIKIELPVTNDDLSVVRTSYIDASVTKINGTYYMIVKNEHQPSLQNDGSYLGLNLQLMKSNNPINNWQVVTTFPLKYNVGIEGCMINEYNNMVYIYAESYADISLPDINSEYSGCWVWKAKKENIETGPYQVECLKSAHSMRHGTVITVKDNYVKRVIKQIGVNFLNTDIAGVTYRYLPLYIGSKPDSQGINPHKITNFAPVQNAIYKVTKGYTIINVNNINNAHDFYILMEEQPLLQYTTRVCIKGDRDIWIGNSASRNGQLLHFRLTGNESSGNLIGNKVRYVGDIATLIGRMGYSMAGKYVLLAKFTLADWDSLQIKMRISSQSMGAIPTYAATYYIKLGHNANGTTAQWKLVDLDYGDWELGAKLFKTSSTEYQLWGHSAANKLSVSVVDYMQKDNSQPFSTILSFPPQIANSYPQATEINLTT